MNSDPAFPWEELPTIRPAQTDDRASIIQTINLIAAEKCYFRTLCYTPTPAWEYLLSHPGGDQAGLLFVVEHQQTIIGYGRLTPDEERPQQVGDLGLGLLPAYRSRRIGTMLLQQLVDQAPRCGFHTLTAAIFATNARSLRLFARQQFAPVAARQINVPFSSAPIEEILVERQL